ncbi:beta-D-glucosyl crocetin beta-1,6-glucosyltransferase-like [Impatiens glandulifera]|uniref:beta-D-glucosyl crocetin beta-1,6-glucosyltransferase-like n=1 Tax=Impatiens glandulifera TaxID=253017 RepID=UPI001FB10840|nr:beta-D-glucosyl crocetin beta-1,6-glucosyltransferase-like [Impatiens glandulifera]
MEAKNNTKLKILMLPWLSHGHISSFLELSRKLSQKNFHIYLCSTPINLKFIEKTIKNNISLSIELIEFHLLPHPDLPPHLHTTNNLPLHLKPTLKNAMHKSSSIFSDILKKIKPDFLIYDYNQPWAAVAASSIGIPSVLFLTSCAAIMAFGSHMGRDPNVEFPFPAIGIRGSYWRKKFLEMAVLRRRSEGNDLDDDSVKEIEKKEELIRRSYNITLLKTFREIEGKYIDYASNLSEMRFISTGPLIKEPENLDGGDGNSDHPIIKWLDTKGKSSTVFVSFGSEYYLSKEEKEEIAHGLELSMTNFIWVLKSSSLESLLPEGFLERVGERGMVVNGWAAQARILSHPSIGAFISHCGWGSTMEAMGLGVPIVAIPMHLDQPFNAQVAVEVGLGLEVKRDENGMLSREEISEVIREIVVEKKGEKIRDKAKQVKEMIQKKGDEDVDIVVEELLKLLNHKVILAS